LSQVTSSCPARTARPSSVSCRSRTEPAGAQVSVDGHWARGKVAPWTVGRPSRPGQHQVVLRERTLGTVKQNGVDSKRPPTSSLVVPLGAAEGRDGFRLALGGRRRSICKSSKTRKLLGTSANRSHHGDGRPPRDRDCERSPLGLSRRCAPCRFAPRQALADQAGVAERAPIALQAVPWAEVLD